MTAQVREGNAAWTRGDTMCCVVGKGRAWKWWADRRWQKNGKAHQLMTDGEATTFFLAIRAAQRGADKLARHK